MFYYFYGSNYFFNESFSLAVQTTFLALKLWGNLLLSIVLPYVSRRSWVFAREALIRRGRSETSESFSHGPR